MANRFNEMSPLTCVAMIAHELRMFALIANGNPAMAHITKDTLLDYAAALERCLKGEEASDAV